MRPELIGLMALGVLNIVLGALVVFVCFRVSNLHKLIASVESRISRVEILTSLADSNPQRSAKGRGQG